MHLGPIGNSNGRVSLGRLEEEDALDKISVNILGGWVVGVN